MKTIRNAVLVAALALIAIPAKASILLEPYVGYQMSNLKETFAGGDYQIALNAPAFGARVGFSKMMFFVAADYMQSSGTTSVVSQPAGGGATADSGSVTMLGVDVGIHIPLLQAYVGYMFMNNFVDKTALGDATYKGTAIKVGAGFTGLPIVAINLEYIMSTYTKYNSGVAGASDLDIGAAGVSVSAATASTVMLSVSAPFNFL